MISRSATHASASCNQDCSIFHSYFTIKSIKSVFRPKCAVHILQYCLSKAKPTFQIALNAAYINHLLITTLPSRSGAAVATTFGGPLWMPAAITRCIRGGCRNRRAAPWPASERSAGFVQHHQAAHRARSRQRVLPPHATRHRPGARLDRDPRASFQSKGSVERVHGAVPPDREDVYGDTCRTAQRVVARRIPVPGSMTTATSVCRSRSAT